MVSEQLEALRQRHGETLTRQRETQLTVAAALKPFARASGAISDAEHRYNAAVRVLAQRQRDAEQKRDAAIARCRREMAAAATTIRETGTSATDTARLLDMTVPELTALLSLVDQPQAHGSNGSTTADPTEGGSTGGAETPGAPPVYGVGD